MYRLPLIVIAVLVCCTMASGQGRTVLGIFAHPDDENMVGSVLAKYARLGNKVYVIIATDGRDGTRVTSIPAGDQLAAVRRKETECACEKLGIERPIFLSLERLDTKIGVRAYLNAHKSLRQKLKEKIEELRPDVLITFGPDGEYGHSEHIVVGSVVQEVLLREGWVERYPLYFALETKTTASDDADLGYVSEKYVNAIVSFTDADDERHNEATKCYVSQFTPDEMTEAIETARRDKTNIRYFRRFDTPRRSARTDLFR